MALNLTIVRGLPGSGKSTIAKRLASVPNTLHIETDMFFMKGEQYCFDGDKLPEAHQWCENMVLEALKLGHNVVVSNTFVRNWEMRNYFAMAKEFKIIPNVIEAKGRFKNTHEVPETVIDRMVSNWEEFDYSLIKEIL